MMIILAILLIFSGNAVASNCTDPARLPNDLILGSCGTFTVCNEILSLQTSIHLCDAVNCHPAVEDCNIYQCFQGSCIKTGQKVGCCLSASDCDDLNGCTLDQCNFNHCTHTINASSCQGNFQCGSGQYCFQCQCLELPSGFCDNSSKCNDNDTCTHDFCDVDNTCKHVHIDTCCIQDVDCQNVTDNCYRTSFCDSTRGVCVASFTDNDRDGIPCPIDCNDFNANVSSSTNYQVYNSPITISLPGCKQSNTLFGTSSLDVVIDGQITLQEDVFYRNLVLLDNGTIYTNGFRIFVNELFVLYGTVSNDGQDALHYYSGLGGPAGTLGGGTNGGLGYKTNGNTIQLNEAGVESTNVPSDGSLHFAGGSTSGNGLTLTSIANATSITNGYDFPLRVASSAINVRDLRGLPYTGGAGGSGTQELRKKRDIQICSGDAGGCGGGGGGGGVIMISAAIIYGGGKISAHGGAGGQGLDQMATQGCAGGGGLIVVNTMSLGPFIQFDVSPGTTGDVSLCTDALPGLVYINPV